MEIRIIDRAAQLLQRLRLYLWPTKLHDITGREVGKDEDSKQERKKERKKKRKKEKKKKRKTSEKITHS
jgi:hypothetical protein